MEVGNLIYNRRKELGLTLEQIGDYVGVSKSTVKKWESGYISNMRRDKISLLAKILQIPPTELINADAENLPPQKSPSTLMGWEDDSKEHSNIRDVVPNNKIHMIPIYATVSAGFGAYAEDNVVDYIPMIIDNPYDVKDTIGIQVKGDSMYPKIEDGDTIIVRKQESVDSGSVAVLLLDGEEGLVKKVEYGKDWIELHSFNPEYKTRRFEGMDVLRLRVVGKVLKVVKSI